MAADSMSLPSQSTDLQHRQHGNDARQQRLADLSGAMAVARLSHQVKELELQKRKQEKPARPTFAPINAIMYRPTLYSLTKVMPECWSRPWNMSNSGQETEGSISLSLSQVHHPRRTC